MTIGFALLRDRLLARPAVRAWLGRVPVGRRIADAHARRLFGIVAGFAQSQMLVAAIELGLIDSLREGPRPRRAVLDSLGIDARGGDALCDALIATALVEPRRGGQLALTIDGLVVATDPAIRAMIAHNRLLYDDLAAPAGMLRAPGTGVVGRFWPYAGDGDAGGYSALMAASQAMVGDAVLAAVDFSGFHRIVDIGGGDGRFLVRLAERAPAARLGLVELPAVLAAARARFAAAGLVDRIELIAADDGLPAADAVTLIRVLHDRDDESAQALLARIAAVMPPGGTVIAAEPVAHAAPDPQAAYFAAYFAAMGSGRLRTFGEVKALLARAGFRSVARSRSFLADVIQAEQSKA